MKQNRILRQILLLSALIASTLLVSLTVSPASAQASSLVCVAASGTTNCPASPPAFTGSPGQTLTVAVNIENSPSFNGFDIAVHADPAVLKATSIDTTGDVFTNMGGILFIAVICVNGHSVSGNCQPQDGPGVAHIAAASNIFVTGGHLFSINYFVTGSGTTNIDYPTGCTGTSNDSFCVTIADGNTGTVVPENLQAATFSTSPPPPPPDFTITAGPASQSIPRGTSTTFTITLTSVNSFAGTVSLGATVSPALRRGPTTSLNPATVTVSPGPSSTSILTVSTVKSTTQATYTVTVTGSSGTLSHSVSVTVTVTK